MGQWYYTRDGKETGPVSVEALAQLAANGELRKTDLVWTDGFKNWVTADNLDELTFAQHGELPPLPGAQGPVGAVKPGVRDSQRPHICRLAMASLALGLLGVGGLAAGILRSGLAWLLILTSVSAIICGHIARFRIAASRSALTGKSMAFAGGYIFGIIPIAALIWLHFQGQTREDARRMNCAVRLKQIGLSCRMYRIDYNGQFPPDFRTMVETKYLDVYKVYLCPSTWHKEGSSPKDLDGVDHCDYLYFGAGGKDAYYDVDKKAAGQVLACDRPGNHHGVFNVVFVDGHVARFSGKSIEKIMTKILARPTDFKQGTSSKKPGSATQTRGE